MKDMPHHIRMYACAGVVNWQKPNFPQQSPFLSIIVVFVIETPILFWIASHAAFIRVRVL